MLGFPSIHVLILMAAALMGQPATSDVRPLSTAQTTRSACASSHSPRFNQADPPPEPARELPAFGPTDLEESDSPDDLDSGSESTGADSGKRALEPAGLIKSLLASRSSKLGQKLALYLRLCRLLC